MTLSGLVQTATDGALGFDTAVPLDPSQADRYSAKGYQFCIRYVSRTDASRANNARNGLSDLSEAEAQLILSAGMALMVVQHVAATGWVPSHDLGASYGANAAQYCVAAGLPAGVCVWLDLEDIPKGTAHLDIKAYANAWCAAVTGQNYVPGIYIGFNVWLSESELFFDLATKHYWRAAGSIPEVKYRGYQIEQHVVEVAPKKFLDKNYIKKDDRGDLPIWLAPSENSQPVVAEGDRP